MAQLDRRTFIASATALAATGVVGPSLSLPGVEGAEKRAVERPQDEPFGYCFNTSTVRGQKLDLKATGATGHRQRVSRD